MKREENRYQKGFNKKGITKHKLNCMIKWIGEANLNQLYLIKHGIEYHIEVIE
jgi:hypothetical protein